MARNDSFSVKILKMGIKRISIFFKLKEYTIKKPNRIRIIRWTVQILFLLFFIFAFLQTRYGHNIVSKNLFFRIDPLIFLVISIANRTILIAGLLSICLIVATLIFGRFFCGYICPLGTVIDIFDTIFRRPERKATALKQLKYLILLFLVVSAILGSSFIHFFDPLVILERSLALVGYPIWTRVAGVFTNITPAVYKEFVISLLIFIAILCLGLITHRFWCRNICPLGGLLALLSKVSLFRFSFKEGCKSCSICENICPTGAIDYNNNSVDAGECIDCFLCTRICPQGAMKYVRNVKPQAVEVKRRYLITSILLGFIAVPVTKFLGSIANKRLIRPPGSLPEEDFLDRCVHCGMCMKACPTNGLQPCVLEVGINGIWTPRLVPDIGGCEKNCNLCGQICPTSAIRKLSLEEKSYVKIGTAFIDRNRCITWEENMDCLICDEVCEYDAIFTRVRNRKGISLSRPFVNKQKCVGCGLCENKCPVEGESAIMVYSVGEERKGSGSYITREKKKLREYEEERGGRKRKRQSEIPSGFILDDE
jgi:polyferredoxin